MSEAWVLAALAVLAWLWFGSMRAREHAVAAGSRPCERKGLQFFDPTADGVSVPPAGDENGGGPLRPVSPFDVCDIGDNRRAGSWVRGALGNPRRGEPVADIDGNGSRPFPVHPEDRGAVAALQERGPGARGALCRGADLPRQPVAAAGSARRADARRLLREPGGKTGRAPRARSHRDRGGSPGDRSGRHAQREDLSGYDLRQS